MISENHQGGMTFTKFFPSDWRTGCLVLNLEEEGLYIRVCMHHYDTGRALPDDDAVASRLLNVHIHKYRKVMDSLITKGKIIRAQGILFNERVQEEIDKYRAERVARSQAAKVREAERRSAQLARAVEEEIQRRKDATPQSTPPPTPQSTPPVSQGVTTLGTQGRLPQSAPEKPNDFNGTVTTAVPQADQGRGTNLESRSQKLEREERTTTTVESDAAVGGGEILDVLNGTAVQLVAFIGKHAMVDPSTARMMLSTNIKTFTADTMMEAYSVTLADMAGGMVARPYKYLIEVARKIKDRAARVPRGRSVDGDAAAETKTEKRRQLVAATMEKLSKEGRPS